MALAAIKGEKTLAESATLFDVHPHQITAWKAQLQEGAARVFGSGSAASDHRACQCPAAQEKERMNISACHNLSVTNIDRLEDSLYGHNCEATGHHDGQGLAFEALDAEGVQIGVIAGYTWARMAEIRQLWVDKTHRGHGLGRKLIESAVAEAVARGCHYAWVTTHSFQAPGLYEKCGFQRAAELADWPPGHTKIILRRRFQISEG